jgi:hypothetical protein
MTDEETNSKDTDFQKLEAALCNALIPALQQWAESLIELAATLAAEAVLDCQKMRRSEAIKAGLAAKKESDPKTDPNPLTPDEQMAEEILFITPRIWAFHHNNKEWPRLSYIESIHKHRVDGPSTVEVLAKMASDGDGRYLSPTGEEMRRGTTPKFMLIDPE